jgi:hypothetical protein
MSDSDASDPLRLDRCASCGYQLQGLPTEGICPECGSAYDQRTIILHGWARGGHGHVGNARPWVSALLALLLLGLVWINWLSRNYLYLAWSVFVVAMMGLALWRRWNSPLPAPIQVRLSASGCRQVDNPAADTGAAPTPWPAVHRVTLKQRRRDRVRVRCECRTPWWRLDNKFPVDADVACTPQRLAALRERIASWQRAANGV